MSYSVNLITTKADCDTLITMSNKEKDDLNFRKTSLSRNQVNYSENSAEINAELQVTNAEIASLTTVIASLPDGNAKDDNAKKLKKLEYRKFLLEDRQDNYGVVALLEKEHDIARIEKELEETDAYILALTTRKAAL
ncbi:MAG: hypothetical protein ACKVOU_13290 [Cytophagales bacterium]